mmetsp:Transcript_6677/g.28473  ORF Transcript_6677/g.28473 Transcript_6677/m.28473 type:complete len:98 (-) Transcript_6677:1173-1466(-)|eukprot:CAMPEP_0113971298 /NCGR_PEP_ID=MMETSP0011_2-20120614/12152_1 /TAXON_ID=101924 /ORGANISM="Rhodosorus marinus" /LENGTH=97 /DNA_ID=CAMNT_0000986765 /DNA_START=179 /DNA_END=472 /DNA_ORIENTATION=+ /assembly_acc=CAM_ASM_000156
MSRVKRPSFASRGVPFVVMICGGYVMLSYYVGGLHDVKDSRQSAVKLESVEGFKKVDLEEVVKETLEEVKADKDYKMVKIPRPEYEEVMGGHPGNDE